MSEGTNAIDPTTAQRFVGEMDRCDEELLTLRGEYMQRCKAVRERKADWVEQAEAAGLPRSGLKVELKRRDLARKIKTLETDAGEEVVETADMIREALGDFAALPLGGAAVEAASGKAAPTKGKGGKGGKAPLVGQDKGGKPKTGADDDADLRGTRQKEREAEVAGQLGGMKPLASVN